MKTISKKNYLFYLITIIVILVNCNSLGENRNETSRPYYGEIDQAGVEFVESQMEEIKSIENDSI